MKKNKSTSFFLFVSIAGHSFFITGLILLAIYSVGKNVPIYLEQAELTKVLYCFIAGYICVSFEWLRLINAREPYAGNADNVPGYLTKKLYGFYPYLFTFGKTNSGNGNTKVNWHKYHDTDVVNKSFIEVFCIHINRNAVILLLILAMLLPNLIIDQTPPSYLKIVQQFPLLYVAYMYLILTTWLTSISVILYRAYLYIYTKSNSIKPM